MVMSSAATNAAAQREVMMIEVWRRLRLGLGILGETSGFEAEFSETVSVFSTAIVTVAEFVERSEYGLCVLLFLYFTHRSSRDRNRNRARMTEIHFSAFSSVWGLSFAFPVLHVRL